MSNKPKKKLPPLEKRRKYHATYLSKYPWVKHLISSKSRIYRLKVPHTLTVKDFRELWFRDHAWELKRPSIDRIKPSLGYVFSNCRFIELSENCRIAHLGRKSTEKQREAGRKNLTKWAHSPRLNKLSKVLN